MTSAQSLVSAVDELISITTVLTTGYEHDESEFIKFVIHQEECRTKWQAAEQNSFQLQRRVSELSEATNSLQVKLKHARSMVETEMSKRQRAESQVEYLERQISLIRELLSDRDRMSTLPDEERRRELESCIAAIEESLSSSNNPSDVSVEPNSEDLLDVSKLRSGIVWRRSSQTKLKEPSVPRGEHETAGAKRVKWFRDDHQDVIGQQPVYITNIAGVSFDEPLLQDSSPPNIPPLEKQFRRPPANRSRRRPSRQHLKDMANVAGSSCAKELVTGSETATIGTNEVDAASPSGLEIPQVQQVQSIPTTLPAELTTRKHTFCSKTVIKPETCQPCGKKIHFRNTALKCKDCRAVCHTNCRDKVPLPCIPANQTPSKTSKMEGMLDSFCPSVRPKVPVLIVRCVREVERRGLTDVGVYRISGAEKDIKDIKDKFLRGKNPDLTRVADINVLCGVLKDFLRNLKEPLLTRNLFGAFSLAADVTKDEESLSMMFEAVAELPDANKDTLAYLMLHLQKVAADCDSNKMYASSLAKIFGPTIVGYSGTNTDAQTMLEDTKKQPVIIEKLLSMPSEYWEQFLIMDDDTADTRTPARQEQQQGRNENTPTTPEPRPVPDFCRLGTSTKRPGMTTPSTQRSPLSPKFGSKGKQSVKKSHYFSSPFTK